MSESSINTILRELRERCGAKQEAVAEACDISRVALTRYENGQRVPRAEIAARLANYYGVSVDYLLGREKPTISVQEKAPRAIDEQIMKELEGMDAEQCREVLNFIRFRKQGGQ